MRWRVAVSTLLSAGALFLSGGAPSARGLDRLRITFFALDQGEATLVETPGEHALLVGAGTRAEGPRIVAWLKSHGIRNLEGVFLQTWKDTHIGGAGAVLKAFPVGQVLTNPCRSDPPEAKKLDQIAGALQGKSRLVFGPAIPGDNHVLNYDPFCEVTMVGPSGAMQRRFRKDPNNSMVLEFRQEKMAFLSLGDTQLKHQEMLLKQLEHAPWGQVLRIGQSGAADSLVPSALGALRTRVAVIPVARKSSQRPDAGVLAALRRAGVRVYRTDTQRTITVLADDRSIDVKTGGPRL
jgi:competence protein ComEC